MGKILEFLRVFAVWTFLGILSKLLFLAIYAQDMDGIRARNWFDVILNGLRLDVAIAGYFTIIPGLLLIVSIWHSGTCLKWIWRVYFFITAFICSTAYIINLGLYGYWRFPLNNTPLLYVRTSPSDALASLTMCEMVGAVSGILLLTSVLCFCFCRKPYLAILHRIKTTQRILWSVLLLLLTALLILPIRGGTGTGTNHTGSVYFSSNMALNHAAVNPVFSFVESVTHQQDLSSQYKFMKDDEAEPLFDKMICTSLRYDSAKKSIQPNVLILILEGFSHRVLDECVTPNLENLIREGLSFSEFYANSYRTDRAIVSILSALPAQPSMSVMDTPDVSTKLPSIARSLKNEGYLTAFYYGGDTNYSNMRSYIRGTGFDEEISEYDFSRSQRTGKWGVHDEYVYQRMLEDIKQHRSNHPFLKVVMTESSHEPFDVPNRNLHQDRVLNAFAYADSCLGVFMRELKQLPCYDNTLVLIVPDHLGAYPMVVDNYAKWRYHIPFVVLNASEITGNDNLLNANTKTIGSQIDIPATLLAMLGIDHSDFVFSKDLLDASSPHFAFVAPNDGLSVITDSASVFYDNISGVTINTDGTSSDSLLLYGKAYLQKLFGYLDMLRHGDNNSLK